MTNAKDARDAWNAFLKAKAEAAEAYMKAIRKAWDEYEKVAAQPLGERTSDSHSND
jgi:hypothetical protein